MTASFPTEPTAASLHSVLQEIDSELKATKKLLERAVQFLYVEEKSRTSPTTDLNKSSSVLGQRSNTGETADYRQTISSEFIH